MSILDFLRRNRGRHETCSGCHWHVVTSGWRSCACKQTASARSARPADTGECRLDRNSTPTGAIAGQQPRNTGSALHDDTVVRGVGDLSAPADDSLTFTARNRRHPGAGRSNKPRKGRSAST